MILLFDFATQPIVLACIALRFRLRSTSRWYVRMSSGHWSRGTCVSAAAISASSASVRFVVVVDDVASKSDARCELACFGCRPHLTSSVARSWILPLRVFLCVFCRFLVSQHRCCLCSSFLKFKFAQFFKICSYNIFFRLKNHWNLKMQ